MRTVSAACAMADVPRTEAAAIVTRMWRRVMLMVRFPFCFFVRLLLRTEDQMVPLLPRCVGSSELDEPHGRHKVLRKRRDRSIGIPFECGAHDRGVLGLDIAGFLVVAPDRKPSIALALLMQHIAKSEQPWRTTGVHQRAVEDAVPHYPFLVVMGRIVGIGVRNGAECGERFLHRGEPCSVAALD